jgi:hypothetical protein
LGLGIVIIRLFVETIEEFSSEAQLLNQINFGMGLVNLLESDDVGMVQLAHDVNFFAKLLEPLFGVDEAEVEAFDGVF